MAPARRWLVTDDEIVEWLGVFCGADHHDGACRDVDSEEARDQVRARLLVLSGEPGLFRRAVWGFAVPNGHEGPFGLEDMHQRLNWLCEFMEWDELTNL